MKQTSEVPVTEILGPWLHNKGNELALRAVIAELGASQTLAVSSNLGLPALPEDLQVQKLAWRPSLSAAVSSGSLRQLARAVGVQGASRRGALAGPSVSRLLDCSGFAYGDAWPLWRLRARGDHFALLKKQGARLVMLPQALGPFGSEPLKRTAREVLRNFDLIFARDVASGAHVLGLGVDPEILQIAPDVTHLIDGRVPRDKALWATRVCIVPNARMVDRTDVKTSARYVAFLAACIRAVSRSGYEPWILLNESNDLGVAREVRMASGIHVHIDDYDGLDVKGIIGACRAVISSRYQPLVAALAQGVPVMATSWSHKFGGLLEDYESSDWLVSPRITDVQAAEVVAALVSPSVQKPIRQRLARLAVEQKHKVEEMWQRVGQVFSASQAASTP